MEWLRSREKQSCCPQLLATVGRWLAGPSPTHILHELPADWPDLLAQGGAEHHALLFMGGQAKDLLHVPAHVWMGCQHTTS